jgi:tetratricopeptide (TPR) repeat protein
MSYNNRIFIFLIVFAATFTSCKNSKSVVEISDTEPVITEKQRIAFEEQLIDANKEKMLSNFDAAQKGFQKCIAIDPNQALPYYELAQLSAENGELAKAYEQVSVACKINPNNYWYAYFKAKLAIELQKIDEAIVLYERLSKDKPGDIEMRYELAGMYLFKGNLKKGFAELDRIEEEMGVSEQISMLKHQVYLKNGEVDKAANEVRKLIKANPGNMDFYKTLADTYIVNGKDEEALAVYKEMEEIAPNDPKLNFALASYFRQRGEEDKAVGYIYRVFENPEADIDNKIKILLDYFDASESNEKAKLEAFELCERLVVAHPEEAKAHAMYADFLYSDKQLNAAAREYRKTLKLDSSRYAIWNQLIIVESELEEYKTLIQTSDHALALFPNQPFPYFFAGIASMQLKNNSQAITYLETGKDYALNNKALKAQFYASLGDAYHADGQKQKAYEAYDKSLKVEPTNVYVLNNYSYYLSLDKQSLDKAAEMASLANKLAPNESSFQDTYGWVLFQQEKYEMAKEWIEKAYNNGGSESAVIVEHLGDVAIMLGNAKEAVEYWNKAKSLGSDSKWLDKKINDEKYYD